MGNLTLAEKSKTWTEVCDVLLLELFINKETGDRSEERRVGKECPM